MVVRTLHVAMDHSLITSLISEVNDFPCSNWKFLPLMEIRALKTSLRYILNREHRSFFFKLSQLATRFYGSERPTKYSSASCGLSDNYSLLWIDFFLEFYGACRFGSGAMQFSFSAVLYYVSYGFSPDLNGIFAGSKFRLITC
jgi:hypothetical protein